MTHYKMAFLAVLSVVTWQLKNINLAYSHLPLFLTSWVIGVIQVDKNNYVLYKEIMCRGRGCNDCYLQYKTYLVFKQVWID